MNAIDISKLSEELAILKREKEKIEEHLLIVGRGSGKFMSQLILYSMLQPEPLKSELLIMIEDSMEEEREVKNE